MPSIAFSFTGLLALLFFQPMKGTGKKIPPVKPVIAESRWTGRLVLEERFTGPSGNSNRKVTVSFINALPTLYRNDTTTDLNFSDDKGTGNVSFHAEGYAGTRKISITDCQGGGKSELHEVVVDEEDNTYRIHAIGPACTGTTVSLLDGKTETYGPEYTDIIVSDQLLTDRKMLGGTKTEVIDLGGDLGTLTRTITWSLSRETSDVMLIVTPEDYDNWMPEPGKDELMVGTKMKISLKLQSSNAQPLAQKAKSFELRLINTSKEKGITLNFPLTPLFDHPDLRFQPQAGALVLEDSQYMVINCRVPAINATAQIGSYDGGGWTTLKAIAILEDNSRVEGELLAPGGIKDIPIPKRDPNSKIATAWLDANGDPGDRDDTEMSRGNSNEGDGLTAYEEYRGVISETEFTSHRYKFGRLDPKKKELGVRIYKAEFALLSPGIRWFEAGSDLKAILFNEREIADDRKFNKHASYAHIFDQLVLVLYKGPLGGDLGRVFNETRPERPTIPARTFAVVIDVDSIRSAYNRMVTQERPAAIPFSLADYIANTVAHELGHGVCVYHHGGKLEQPSPQIVGVDILENHRIFRRNGSLELTENFVVEMGIGMAGGLQSGDLNCVMNYVPHYFWAYTIGADLAEIFNEVPLLPVGRKICNSPRGTGINATTAFFGDASRGNCLAQIKLK